MLLAAAWLPVFVLIGSFHGIYSRSDKITDVNNNFGKFYEPGEAAPSFSGNYRIRIAVPDTGAANPSLSRYKRDSNPQLHIEDEKEKLDVLNDDIEHLLQIAVATSWKYVNDHNITVGDTAMKLNQEYVEKSTDFVRRLVKLKEFADTQNKSAAEEINKKFPEIEEYQEKLNIIRNGFIKLEHLYNMTNRYYDIHGRTKLANNLTEEYISLKNISILKDVHEEKVVINKLLLKQLKEAHFLDNFTTINRVQDFFVTNFTIRLLDVKVWEALLDNHTKELIKLENQIEEEELKTLLEDLVQPIVKGIMFVIGFMSNSLLLLILISQKQLNTAFNLMVMNLTFGNILMLIVNIPTFYGDTMSGWEYGREMCIVFRFFRQLFIGVCVYSVVLMSVQRLLAVIDFKWHGTKLRVGKTVNFILSVLSIWIIGSLIAVPHVIYAGIFNGNCYAASPEIHINFPKMITLFDLFGFCIIPIVIIICITTLSTQILGKSFQRNLDEPLDLSEKNQSGSFYLNIIKVLTVMFIISLLPFYIFLLVCSWFDFNFNMSVYYILFFITHIFFLGNFCFSPIALYIFNQTYRRYFNMYLLCQCRKTEVEYKGAPRKTSIESEVTKL